MRSRLELSAILHSIAGSKKIYYQPPESVKMEYPCLRYSLKNIKSDKADNINYKNSKCYTLTAIDTDPDSVWHEALLDLPYCTFDRVYVADGLYHFVYTIYF